MFLENLKSTNATIVAIPCSYEGTSARAYGICRQSLQIIEPQIEMASYEENGRNLYLNSQAKPGVHF